MSLSPRRLLTSVLVLVLGACPPSSGGDDAGPDAGSHPDAGVDAGVAEFSYCQGKNGPAFSFSPGQEQAIQDAVNTLAECSTITLAAGTYTFTNAITIRQKGVTLLGAGKGQKGELTGTASSSVLVFTGAVANTNGVDHVGDWFTIRGLAIVDARKDALRIEASSHVKIQQVRTEWTNQNSGDNGKYGIYPVKSSFVLVEDCEAYNAADAAIYVGQTTTAIVRNNVAKQNVAGIEIENTQYADVYGNLAEDNTAGLVVFDLPGNQVKGTDIKLHDNVIRHNNRPNFAAISASSSTVSQVPAGTGTFMLASRRVEVTGNTYLDNNSADLAVLSGLSIERDPQQWVAGGYNFDSSDIWVHGNVISGGSGDDVDNGNLNPVLRPMGVLVYALYQVASQAEPGGGVVDTLIWDGVDPVTGNAAANQMNLCFGANTLPDAGPLFSVANLDFLQTVPLLQLPDGGSDPLGAFGKVRQYAQGQAPFNCAGFLPVLSPVTLPP